jgi:hypothetical protein
MKKRTGMGKTGGPTHKKRKRRWTDEEWKNVLAKPVEEWTDEELEEYDRRTAELIATMTWFDVEGIRYFEINHLLSQSDWYVVDKFRKHNIRGFFQREKVEENLFMHHCLIERSMDVHRGFRHRLLFLELIKQEMRDISTSGVQYNIDTGTTVGVKGPYHFHGENDWIGTHFICQVCGSQSQLEPDFILILPIPNLFPFGISFN